MLQPIERLQCLREAIRCCGIEADAEKILSVARHFEDFVDGRIKLELIQGVALNTDFGFTDTQKRELRELFTKTASHSDSPAPDSTSEIEKTGATAEAP